MRWRPEQIVYSTATAARSTSPALVSGASVRTKELRPSTSAWLRWLRKAILRTDGVIALHDEETAFAKENRGAASASPGSPGRLSRGPRRVQGGLLEGVAARPLRLGLASPPQGVD